MLGDGEVVGDGRPDRVVLDDREGRASKRRVQVLDGLLDLRVVALEADVAGDVEQLLGDVVVDADGTVVAGADVPTELPSSEPGPAGVPTPFVKNAASRLC